MARTPSALAERMCCAKAKICPWSRRERWSLGALAAADALAAQGVNAGVLNVSTIKPLDETAIVAAARETGAIVTVEEAVVQGGLGPGGRRNGRAQRAGSDAHPRRYTLRPDRDRRIPL